MKTFGSGQTSGVPLLVTASSFATRQTLHTAVAGTGVFEVIEVAVDRGPVQVEIATGAASVTATVHETLTVALNGGATIKVWDEANTDGALVRALVDQQAPTLATTSADTITEAVLNSGVTVDGVLLKDGGVTLADAGNVIVNATTGSKIGTAVTQKLGFWNATPVVQPASAAQAASAAQSQTDVTDSTGGTASTTLAAITAGASYAQADLTAIKNALASVAAELALIKTDVANTRTLQTAMRTALVNTGIIKGAA